MRGVRWGIEFAEQVPSTRDPKQIITKVTLSRRARTLDEAVSIALGRWRDGMRFVDIINVEGPQATLAARYDGTGWTGRAGEPIDHIGRRCLRGCCKHAQAVSQGA